MNIRLKRYSKNPILKPIKTHDWEEYVFNCAVIALDNKVHILYRALSKDKVSRIGYASSKDGFHIDERLEKPIFVPKLEIEKSMVKFHNSGIEDPRLTRIGNRIYMLYAAFNGRTAQSSIASIKVKDFLQKKWNWKRHGAIFPHIDDRNTALFPEKINGKYVLFTRFMPNIWVSYSRDLKNWSSPKIMMKPRTGMWDEYKVGIAGPPIKLKDFWLLVYHGVEQKKVGRVYRLGFILIDLKNPEKILYRSKEPIFEPVKDYELKGQVPTVVFSCGAVVKEKELFLYYGGADTVIGVATADISKFL
jgi:predicted GH43/DUF377 family glycosyl hydrolase